MLLVVGLLEIIWGLRVFTQIYVLQEAGGITRETNLLGTYIYRLGIAGGDFGTAAAVAIFMLVLTVVLTAPYVRTMLRNEELEEAEGLMARRTSTPVRLGADLAGLLVLLVCAFPVYWMVNTSLLPRNEIRVARPHVHAVRRHAGELPPGALRRRVRRRPGRQPGRHARHGRGRAGVRVPGRAGGEPLPVPRPQELHRDAAAGADDPGRGAVHQPVQDARGLRPAQHRGRPDPRLRRQRAAVHDLGAARASSPGCRSSSRRPR